MNSRMVATEQVRVSNTATKVTGATSVSRFEAIRKSKLAEKFSRQLVPLKQLGHRVPWRLVNAVGVVLMLAGYAYRCHTVMPRKVAT